MPNLPDELKALEFVSNVIQFEEDKRYLFVFRNATQEAAHTAIQAFRAWGIQCIGMALFGNDELTIVEMPEEKA